MVLATDLNRMQQLALSRYGQNAHAMVGQWRAMIDHSRTLPESQRINLVNDFFNQRIRFRDDIVTWKQKDYWATPLETMGRQQGDCEDFSIAKFITLLLSGIDMDKLRITYVKAVLGTGSSRASVAHMVLAYYPKPNADPLILDNLIPRILPGSKRSDLTPVFGFNSKGLWVGGATSASTNNPGAKLSRWRDLLQRMQQDGLG